MKTTRFHLLIPLILFGLFMAVLPSQIVRADTGPKASMQFTFFSQIKPEATILSGQLFECQDSACSNPEPLRQLGPQRFECQSNTCYSVAYSASPYYRLEIEFSDGVTRTSNIFTKHAYAANYRVTIEQDSLKVEEISLGANVPFFKNGAPTLFDLLATVIFPLMEIILPVILVVLAIRTGRAGAIPASYSKWLVAAWLLAIPAILTGMAWTQGLMITLVVELLLGAGYVIWKKRSAKVILTVILLLNLITQPALWVTVSGFSGLYPVMQLILAEIVVVLVEAGGLYLSQRSSMRFREALWVSFTLNAASFIAGSLLPL